MASVAKREWTHKGDTKTAWVVRYREGDKHRSKQFEKKKEADTYKRKVEAEIEAGVHIPPSEALTIRALCEEYIRWQESRWKDGRIGQGRFNQIKLAVDSAIVPHLGTMLVTDLKVLDVENWYAALCRLPPVRRMIRAPLTAEEIERAPSKAGPSRKTRRMLPSTAKDRVRELLYAFRWGETRGRVKRNVVEQAMKELRGVRKARIKTPSTEDVFALLQAIEERPRCGQFRAQDYLRCAVHLAAFCGLRWGEVMGLTVGNIDIDRRLIRIRHSLTHWDELKGPKSEAGNRDVFMPNHVATMLASWLRDHYAENERQIVFRGRAGERKDAASFHRGQWVPLLKRAGIWTDDGDSLHFHALRHFAVSAAIQSGLPLTDVPGFIGHRDLNTTLGIYTHSVGNSRQDLIANAMAHMLLPALHKIDGTLAEPA